MFGKQRVANAMNARLPSFERPACQTAGCVSKLDEPRPIMTEPQGAPGVLTVHCIARCPVCRAEYKGERMVGLGKRIRALEQSFHPYNDEDRQFVAEVLAKCQQQPGRVAQIKAMPING